MICISVTPASRKLGMVDLYNASPRCDLIELCLDNLIKEPDVGKLLEGVTKPVIISCRRLADGGKFQGTEDERQALLRQAIVAGPAYIELEADIAGKIPRFGNTKRIISHTSLDGTFDGVEEIFSQANRVNADVVKLTGVAQTLQAAWRLLSVLGEPHDVPVVGVGLGAASATVSMLSRRNGSPWIYAALEKGMEAYPGQLTVYEVSDVYAWREIRETTRFIGVASSQRPDETTIGLWNSAFRQLNIDKRCVPLLLDSLDDVQEILASLRIKALLVGRALASEALAFAKRIDESAQKSEFADMLLHLPQGWFAHNRIGRSTVKSVEQKLSQAGGGQHPLERRNVLVLGAGGLARSVVNSLGGHKGILSISAPDDKQARQIAEASGLRHVPFAGLYETLADVVILADPELASGYHKTEINPSFLRPTMLVADICCLPETSEFLRQALERGATIVDPRDIYLDRLSWQFRTLNGKILPDDVRQALAKEPEG